MLPPFPEEAVGMTEDGADEGVVAPPLPAPLPGQLLFPLIPTLPLLLEPLGVVAPPLGTGAACNGAGCAGPAG